MGKNYDTDAERRDIEMWLCKTCGRGWPVKGRNSNWTAANAEEAARTCCSENSWCFVCKKRRTRYPHHACDVCAAIRNRERWEKCEERPVEFPLTLQDGDQWFYSGDDLDEYCDEHELKAENLLLRIGRRVILSMFEPSEFWCDEIAEDDKPTDDGECRELAAQINAWATKNIITYEMGPFRPRMTDVVCIPKPAHDSQEGKESTDG